MNQSKINNNSKVSDREKQRIFDVSEKIYKVANSLNILTRLGWSGETKLTFFKHDAQKIPQVTYPPYDAKPIIDSLEKIKSKLKETPVDDWFKRHIQSIELSASMLQNCGKKEFFDYSSQLYGKPKDTLKDEKTNSLELAHRFLEILKPMDDMDLGKPPDACYLASTVAAEMEKAVLMFGDLAPKILVVDDLSANALAGAERIRIRKNACFTDRDIQQLVNHEVYIHVGTLLNGKTKGNVKLLELVHAGSTKTQEGLAVFAEFITGSIDIDRMKRLANRVLAIQQAIDGADFIDVYRYFLDHTDSQDQSYENARRVFRGGVNSGGAPFTKDIVYLDGLLKVHNFMRAAVSSGRADCLMLLFAGRMDIEDIPVVAYLHSIGLCQPAKFLPPWAADQRFLFCYLSYSSFLNTVDMSKVKAHYQDLLNNTVRIC